MKFSSAIFAVLLTFSYSVTVTAQTEPFAEFKNALKNERGGFAGNKENLSTVFQRDRKKLGDTFEPELWKYLDDDIERHRWLGLFLETPSYLHGNKPLPDLALAVWQRGIDLTRKKANEKNDGARLWLLINATILAESSGKTSLAREYKDEADQLAINKPETRYNIPGLSEYDRCIYKNVGLDKKACDEIAARPKGETIVSGGILNGRALKLPPPKYSDAAKKARAQGQVRVKVLIDFDGNVIEATGIDGRPELYEASVEAAKGAKFSPMKLSGKPVKLSGVLIFSFVL